MVFSTNGDLQEMWPDIVVKLDIASVTPYHEQAANEVGREIRKIIVPAHREFNVLYQFDYTKLDISQMKRAACLRVLAYHTFPRLNVEQVGVSTKDTTDNIDTTVTNIKNEAITVNSYLSPDYNGIAKIYTLLYNREIKDIISDGILYQFDDGQRRINIKPFAELQRQRR